MSNPQLPQEHAMSLVEKPGETWGLPYEPVAEDGIISAGLFFGESLVQTLTGLVRSDQFVQKNAKAMFAAMEELVRAGKPVSDGTVLRQLRAAGFNGFGDEFDMWLASLSDGFGAPMRHHAEAYAEVVAEQAVLRGYLEVSRHIREWSLSRMPAAEIGAKARLALADVERGLVAIGGPRHISEVIAEELVAIEARRAAGGVLPGLSTGFEELDEYTDGVTDGALWVVGSRPAMGKSAWAVGLASKIAEQGRSVLMFSLEMRAGQLAQRMMSSSSEVVAARIRAGLLDEDEWIALQEAISRLSGLAVYIDDDARSTAAQIRTKAMRMQAENGAPPVIILDYVQLVESEDGREARHLEVAEVSRALKRLARELNSPVIALAQVGRQVEQRPNKRPQLADLAESKQLEADADVVMFLYRDEVYDDESPDKGVAELIVAKSREGRLGTVRTAFRGKTMSFQEPVKMGVAVNQEQYDRVVAALGSDSGMAVMRDDDDVDPLDDWDPLS